MGDTHPPLYYFSLLAWTSVFGAGEYALRSLSVFFGVLTIPVVFSIGRLLAGTQVGLIAAALLATSPIHVQYSTEVRMYSLLPLMVSVALWGAVRFAMAPAHPKAGLQGVGAFAIGSVLAGWTQIAGLFVIPSASLFMVLGWYFGGRARSAALLWLTGNIVVLIVLLASVPMFVTLMHNAAGLAGWIPAPTVRVIGETVGSLLAQKLMPIVPYGILALVAGGFALAAAGGAWDWRRDPRKIGFVVLIGILPFCLTIAVSLILKPIFITRIHLWSLIPIYLMIAAAIVALRGRLAGTFLIVFLSLCQTAGLYAYHFDWGRPDWRSAIALISASSKDTDIIVTPPAPGVDAVIGYYAPRLRPLVLPVAETSELPAMMAATEGRSVWNVTSPWHDRVDATALANALAQRHVPSPPVSFLLVTVQLWRSPPSGSE